MELRQLHYFAAVAHTLNFRRAAEQLHITRPALSMQIRNLEDELGLRLLERTTARVRLTDAGSVYLREVKRILALIEQAGEMAHQAAKHEAGRIALGGIGALTPSFLPSVLRTFNHKFPHVTVEIIDLLRDEHLRVLKAGTVQLAFEIIDENSNRHDGLHYEPIRNWKLAISTGKHHPLAGLAAVRPQDLVNETFVVFDRRISKNHSQKIRSIFQSEGLPEPKLRYVQSFDTLTAFVAADQGVSLTLDVMEFRYNDDVRVIPLEHTATPLHVTLYAIWKKNNASELVKNFVNILKEDTLNNAN